jgi:hypothetical protein
VGQGQGHQAAGAATLALTQTHSWRLPGAARQVAGPRSSTASQPRQPARQPATPCPATPCLPSKTLPARPRLPLPHLRMFEKGRRPRPSTLTKATSPAAIFSVGASSRTAGRQAPRQQGSTFRRHLIGRDSGARAAQCVRTVLAVSWGCWQMQATSCTPLAKLQDSAPGWLTGWPPASLAASSAHPIRVRSCACCAWHSTYT